MRKRRTKLEMELVRAIAFDSAKHQLDACVESLRQQRFKIVVSKGVVTLQPIERPVAPIAVSESQNFEFGKTTIILPRRKAGQPRKIPTVISPSRISQQSLSILRMAHEGKCNREIVKEIGCSLQSIYNLKWQWKGKTIPGLKKTPVRVIDVSQTAKKPYIAKVRATAKTKVQTKSKMPVSISGKDLPDAIPVGFLTNGSGKHKTVNRIGTLIHKISAKG